METRLEIRIQSGDAAIPARMQEAYNLVGGPSLKEKGDKREFRVGKADDFENFTVEEVKLFSRIKANVFTLTEAKQAVEVIKRRRDELHRDADTLDVFIDPKVQKAWADGVKANANLAVRLAEDFMANLLSDLSDMEEREMA